ncbi:uncharacterized protein LOC128262480 [Drosophila gunungcola]|uniref:uncharacterized protein LOC108147821 n=1 Tax=Drosophila elegans TaxID=30023 RepID=UPI0007E6F5CB|nr:uncharacterized protein LOC108147821 [Drosophila elegans]XP_052852719.1 uncharacterized protein LOC128262480 [Drosophila gunungcola]
MNWLVFGLLLLSVSFAMEQDEATPYICDGKDDRVCDQYRCMCRRKPSTKPDQYFTRTEYEF